MSQGEEMDAETGIEPGEESESVIINRLIKSHNCRVLGMWRFDMKEEKDVLT